MRCLSCDCALTDFESTRKSAVSGSYVDLCGNCFTSVGDMLDTTENFLLFDPTLDSIESSAGIDVADPLMAPTKLSGSSDEV